MSSDRITRVSLVANVSNYVTGMNQAAQSTRATATAAQRLAAQGQTFDKLGKGLLSIGTVATAAVAISVKKFAEFDAAMSSVQAATHASATTMAELRGAAIDAGAKTVYSATEAAGAIEELSKAGLTSKDILGGGLAGALNLAAAGGLEVADAAQQTAIALKQFNLTGDQASHVADLFAAGAGKAVGDVSDLSAALGQAGLVANQTGLSIEETTGTLAAFADQGLLGSDAGTSLKTMLQSLVPNSQQAADEFKKLGISAYDAQGNFVGIANFAGQYQTALKKLSPEQQAASAKILFGSDAVRAANVLYTEGASGIQKYIDQTNDSGYAAETARLKLDNLKGDIEQLGGAFDTALIQTGSGANGSLREITQSATFLVGAVGNLPGPVLAAAVATGTLTAATALTGGAALVAIPKLAAFRATLAASNVSLKTAALRTAGAGLALGGLGIAIGAIVSNQAAFAQGTAELTDTLDKSTGALTKYSRAYVAKQLADKGVFAAAKEAGVSQKELTDAVLEGGDAVDRVKEKFGKTNTFGNLFTGVAERSGFAQLKLSTLSKQVQQSQVDFKDLGAAGADAADGTEDVTGGLEQLDQAATNSTDALSDLKDQIDGLGSTTLDLRSAQRDMQAAIDGVTDSVKDNGKTLDIGTEKGRANQEALDGIAEKAKAVASATLEQTQSQGKASAAIAKGRAELIAALGQFGITGAAAQAYADKLGLIPKNVTTQAYLNDQEAKAEAGRLLAQLEKLNGTTVHNVIVKSQNQNLPDLNGKASGSGRPGLATGGHVRGPGTSTSDSIPTLLSDGEFVVKASSVQKYGLGTLAALNAGSLPRFAKGGPVAVGAAKRKLEDAEAAQKRSQAEYDRIKSSAAKGRLETAKARTAAAEKALKAAQDAPTGASSSDRISFRSTVRAGDFDSDEGVRSLYQMGQDASAYSSKARKAFIAQANRSEVRMLKLEKASDKAGAAVEKAADKLGDLKDKSSSLASSIASNLSGQGVSDFGSASSFARGQSRTAATLKQLGPVLDKLKKKGLSPALIAQIAGLEPVEALRMAKSFDALSGAGIKSVNADYKSVQSTSAAIGKQVADANYGAQIKAAQTALTDARKNAKAITTELKNQGLLLRKVVGKGLGLKGYAAGGFTGLGAVNRVAGVVHAGEFVTNARATANPRNRMVLEAMNQGQYLQPTYVRGGSSTSIDYDRLAVALKGAASVVRPEFHAHAKENMDAQTAMTIMSREINREFAGLVV